MFETFVFSSAYSSSVWGKKKAKKCFHQTHSEVGHFPLKLIYKSCTLIRAEKLSIMPSGTFQTANFSPQDLGNFFFSRYYFPNFTCHHAN